jgi:hypothetical protein
MSYSFTNSCHLCVQEKECTDRHFIAGGIQGIHYTSSERTHKGSGTVELRCNRLELKEAQ